MNNNLSLLLFPGRGTAHDKIEDLVRRNVTIQSMFPFYELHQIRLHDHQTLTHSRASAVFGVKLKLNLAF